ncbi:unnamed protein product, partial [Prorocentrum cordatum]
TERSSSRRTPGAGGLETFFFSRASGGLGTPRPPAPPRHPHGPQRRPPPRGPRRRRAPGAAAGARLRAGAAGLARARRRDCGRGRRRGLPERGASLGSHPRRQVREGQGHHDASAPRRRADRRPGRSLPVRGAPPDVRQHQGLPGALGGAPRGPLPGRPDQGLHHPAGAAPRQVRVLSPSSRRPPPPPPSVRSSPPAAALRLCRTCF